MIRGFVTNKSMTIRLANVEGRGPLKQLQMHFDIAAHATPCPLIGPALQDNVLLAHGEPDEPLASHSS